MKTTYLMAALLTAVSLPAFAESATKHADKRQNRQEARIEQGVKSGRLTEQEAARLEKGQEHVDKLETKAMADGEVTAKERARLEHAQDVQSKKIYYEKHDAQRDLNHDGKKDPHKRPKK